MLDRLWKHRRQSCPRYAMQSFRPPIVLRDTQAIYTWCLVHQLFDFLIQGEPGNQIIYSLINGHPCILKSKLKL